MGIVLKKEVRKSAKEMGGGLRNRIAGDDSQSYKDGCSNELDCASQRAN